MAVKRKRKLTPEQKQYLIDLKKKPNEDDIRYKEIKFPNFTTTMAKLDVVFEFPHKGKKR